MNVAHGFPLPLDHYNEGLAIKCCKGIQRFIQHQVLLHHQATRCKQASPQDERSVYTASNLPNHAIKMAVNASLVAQAIQEFETGQMNPLEGPPKELFNQLLPKTVQHLRSVDNLPFLNLLLACETDKAEVPIASVKTIRVLVQQFVEDRFKTQARL